MLFSTQLYRRMVVALHYLLFMTCAISFICARSPTLRFGRFSASGWLGPWVLP